jgi:hypothetical protein
MLLLLLLMDAEKSSTLFPFSPSEKNKKYEYKHTTVASLPVASQPV